MIYNNLKFWSEMLCILKKLILLGHWLTLRECKLTQADLRNQEGRQQDANIWMFMLSKTITSAVSVLIQVIAWCTLDWLERSVEH